MFSPFRMLSSLKTTGARRVFFERFFRELKANGLPDPLSATNFQRLTVSTDFETTFAVSLGLTLAENFRPNDDMANLSLVYAERVMFGCGVHAKRIILEKVESISREYDELVGSRNLTVEADIKRFLEYMKTMNDKCKRFAIWLENHYIARVLWFWKRYKEMNSALQQRVLWPTNVSESQHALLKGSIDYLVTRSTGMDLMSFISFLEKIDKR